MVPPEQGRVQNPCFDRLRGSLAMCITGRLGGDRAHVV
jgi:hypothetical protein